MSHNKTIRMGFVLLKNLVGSQWLNALLVLSVGRSITCMEIHGRSHLALRATTTPVHQKVVQFSAAVETDMFNGRSTGGGYGSKQVMRGRGINEVFRHGRCGNWDRKNRPRLGRRLCVSYDSTLRSQPPSRAKREGKAKEELQSGVRLIHWTASMPLPNMSASKNWQVV